MDFYFNVSVAEEAAEREGRTSMEPIPETNQPD